MHHRRGLRRLTGAPELGERVATDFERAGLDERRLAMLRYADKLTRTPAAMTRADAEALRGQGFSDEDLLGIVEVAAYYAYANRVVDGLGVTLEPELEGPP